MDRHVSPVLFAANFDDDKAITHAAYELTTAREIDFKEDWLQKVIVQNPELVIAACREAGLTDEAWMYWASEFRVESAGDIDVLLVSESGRIAIVETKLSYNPEGRRSVIAQTLEYVIHFPAVDVSRLPPIPEMNGRPFADRDIVQSRIQEGDYLLAIAGDQLDSRAVKLGQSLLGRHLVRGWDLALIEVAVFRKISEDGSRQCLFVPYLRGAIIPERRQVVRIVIDGDRTRVDVEPMVPVAMDTSRQKQTEDEFFAALPVEVRAFADGLRGLRLKYPQVVSFGFGTSSLILRNRDANILEFYHDGRIRFRTNYFEQGLGQELGANYHEKLRVLFPMAMQMNYPSEKLDARRAGQLLELIAETLGKANLSPT